MNLESVDAPLRNMIALGTFVVLAVLLGPARLRLPLLGPALGLAALGLAWGLGAVAAGAPLEGLPQEATVTVLGWFLLGSAARAAGGPRLPAHPGYAAFTAGLLMGDLAAGAWLLPLVKDRALGARLAVVAAGGALMSPVGTPARLLLVDLGALAWMPIAMVALAMPLQELPRRILPEGRWAVSAVLVATMGLAFDPAWRMAAVVGGAVVLSLMAPREARHRLPWREMLWVLGFAGVVGAARSAGLWAELRLGLGLLLGLSPGLAVLAVVCGGAVLALLVGEAAGAVLLWSVLDAGAGAGPGPLVAALALALAVGEGGLWRGLEGLRATALLRSVQLAVVLAWALWTV